MQAYAEYHQSILFPSFVLSLVSFARRVPHVEVVHWALHTRVPSAKRLRQHLSLDAADDSVSLSPILNDNFSG